MTEAQVPSADQNPDKLIDLRKMSFRFKKDSVGNKRANVDVEVGVPSYEGIIDILTRFAQNPADEAVKKEFKLLQDSMADTVRTVLAGYVGDNENAAQDTIPWDKFSWAAIANMPQEDRRSIPAEQWEGFVKDYIAVMPGKTGKSLENVTNATQAYLKKLAPWKSDKKTIGVLQAQLALYMETPNAEQFSDVLELLTNRAKMYLAADDLAMIANNL